MRPFRCSEGLLKDWAFDVTEDWRIVILEGWMVKRPVIVHDRCPAFKELVTDGVNGWIVESESPVALAAAMERAYACKWSLYRMGLEARKAAEALTWETYGARVRDFYRALLNDDARHQV